MTTEVLRGATRWIFFLQGSRRFSDPLEPANLMKSRSFLRKMQNIQHSYYSRISNAEVLARLQAPKLSTILLGRQLAYFGALARRPSSCPVRQLVFTEDLALKPSDVPRRRGRPKLEWANELFKVVDTIFDSREDFRSCVVNAPEWRSRIREFSRAKPP